MQRLREVIGDNNNNNSQQTNDCKLDEQTISREDLNKKIQDCPASQRIVEVGNTGEYKTLNRMYS